MSVLSLEKPINSANIYQITKPVDYCHEDFTILMPLDNHIQMMKLHFNESEMLLLPPYTPISIQPEGNCALGCIQFNNKHLLTVLDSDELFANPHTSSDIITLFDCQPVIRKLLQDYNSSSITEISRLFFSFADVINSIFTNAEAQVISELTDKGLDIIQFIDEHLLSNLSLNDTAAYVGLTPQYLASFFQKALGCTFKDYVNRKKCSLALPFLKYTKLTEDAIAALIGFTSATTMEKAILSNTGSPSSTYRLLVKNHSCNLDFDRSTLLLDFAGFQNGDITSENEADIVTTNAQIVSCNSNPDELLTNSTNWKSILNIGISISLADLGLREQIVKVQDEIGFEYGRILDLLDTCTPHVVDNHTYYLFDNAFKTLDFLIDQKLKPCIVLGNRYKKGLYFLSESASISAFEDHQSYFKKLELILPPFIRSCCNRYGMNVVSQWVFEISYDNLSRVQGKQTIWHYVTNYARIENIIHLYCPRCIVGGPNFNTCGNMSEFENLLRTLKSEHITPDFISLGIFGLQNVKGVSAISPSGSALMERATSYVKLCKHYFPKLPIYASEFNSTYDRKNFLNDSVFQSCLVMWFIANRGKLFDGIGYLKMSDRSDSDETSNQLFYGGSGFLNSIGLRKPSYYSFHFLNELGPIFIHQENGVLVAGRSRYSYQAILYHCPALTKEAAASKDNAEMLQSDAYAFETLADKTINLIINEMIPGQYLVKIYRINRSTGNLLREFAHLSGISEITQVDVECLRYLSNPGAYLTQVHVTEDGIFRLPVTIEALELVMIHIDFNNKGNSNV